MEIGSLLLSCRGVDGIATSGGTEGRREAHVVEDEGEFTTDIGRGGVCGGGVLGE